MQYGWDFNDLKTLGLPHFIYIIIQVNKFMIFKMAVIK